MIALALLLTACNGPDTSLEAAAHTAALVPVVEVATVDLDSVLPSDVLWRPDGDLLVLDGHQGRILRYGPDGAARGSWAEGIGRAVRLSPAADGGVWAVVPGDGAEAGGLLHLSASGAVDAVRAPQAADGTALHPVDVVDLGGALLVAERSGALSWLDPGTGAATRTVTEGPDHAPLRRIVDLEPDGDVVVAVDTLVPRVLRIGADGTPDAGFGRRGLSDGHLFRPTSAAVVPGGLLVADSVLGAVQAFEADGDPIGLLAVAGAPIAFGHPVAVRIQESSLVAVLAAKPARLHLLRLPGPLPEAPPPSLLRTTLVEADADPAGTDGTACVQCHDGLVLDGREVWDPGLGHHPRDMVPVAAIPAFFPLEDGKIVCTTCHSPHGVVDPEDVATGSAVPLLRHQGSSSFLRLDAEADALCLACHTENEHAGAGSGTLGDSPASAGHPTGAALVAALTARTDGSSTDPTQASCLSCHAMHGATGDAITRDPNDGATCLGCHPAMAEKATNHPLGNVPGRDLGGKRGGHVVLSAAGGIGCLSCHDLGTGALTGLLRALPSGRAVCLDCHDERTDLQGSAHAHLARGGSPTCTSCHDVHGGQRDARFLTAAPVTEGDPTGCLSCHGPGKRGASAGAAPGRAGHPVTGQALEGGGALTCLTCHDAHAADVPKVASCDTCHAPEAAAADRGGHGAATCLDCHPAHGEAPAAPAALARATNPASSGCLGCHAPGTSAADAPKLASWEHPVPTFLPDGTRWTPLAGLTLYTAAGIPAATGANGDLACQSCHVVHGPEPTGEDHLRKAGGWKEACAACHGDEALVVYRYFHQPDRRGDLRGTSP
ncbi:MAG: cytochrome c3 family protein [Pseudomonadota bacterium]|nr:cytochrome c3 family protein [Pseudomonadota bacterium]